MLLRCVLEMQHCGYFLDRHIRLLCASGAELVPFFNDFSTSCVQNLQFDAKNSLACASLNRKSCKLLLDLDCNLNSDYQFFK